MKLKNLILLSTLVMLFTMFLGTQSTYAATWYVDNLVGNDSWDGQSAVPAGDGIHGPKKTISGGAGAVVGALRAAVAGDIIYVANTGTAYQEGAGLELAGGFTVDKQITFRGYQSLNPSTVMGVTIAVSNFTVNITTGTTTCTFDSGTFTFALTGGAPSTFYLQAGTVNDASAPITVGGAATTILIKRNAGAVSATGQFNFAGTIDFEYNTGAAVATGNEFVAAGGTFRNLTTTGAATALTIGRSVIMTGTLATAGTVNLSAGTLTVQNTAAVTHTLGNNVTNGTLDFNMSGAAAYTVTVNGAVQINNVKARGNANTLDIAQPTRITGTLLTQGSTSVVNSGNSILAVDGTVKAESTSNITLGATTATIGTSGNTGWEIWNNGKGIVTVSPATVHGNVLLDPAITSGTLNVGEGQIMFGAAVTVNGNVTNSTTFTFTDNGNFANTDPAASTGLARFDGVISFPNAAVTINGTVTMGGGSAWSQVTTTAIRAIKWNGMIVFNNTTQNLTITGSLVNSVVATLNTAYANTMSDCGIIVFPALTNGTIRIDGGISNSAQFTTLVGMTDNGVIDFDYFEAAGTAFGAASHVAGGSFGAALNRIGAVVNSSKGFAAGDGNGDIIFATANTVDNPFFGTSVTVSGTAVGGYTVFGNGNFNVNGNVVNSRTHASTSLQVGTVATAAKTVTIGGYLSNQGTATTSFVLTSTGNVTVTGKLESTANGTIQFPGLTTAASNFGPLNLTNGTITIPANDGGAPQTSVVNFVGNSNMSGGALNLAATAPNGGAALTFSGNSSSVGLVGGTITMTNRGAAVGIVSNATTIQIGNGTANPTFTNVPIFTVSTPSPVGPVTVNIGTLQPVFAGIFNVASSAGITTSVTIQGGLFQPGVLQLNSLGLTNINNATIYLTAAGNVLINNGGYTTSNNGRIVFAGTAGQNITAPVTPGVFGDIEINNNSVAGVITGAGLGNFAGTLYLTSGLLDNTINFTVDATTPVNPAPSPNVVTVVVNQGTLTQQPNYVAMANITYVGLDKSTGNELPAAANKLNNLLVATTNGTAGTGQGSVLIKQNAVVNGTLTVNAGQFLVIGDGLTLQLNGPANLAGSVTNVGIGVAGQLVLNGATVTASGYLPTTVIANGTNANTITGVKAFIDGLLGNDAVVGSYSVFAAPYNVASADYSLAVGGVANGEIIYAGLNGTLSLGVGASPFTSNNSTNLDGITTVGANNLLTLTTNVTDAGTVGLNHGAGTINVGAFNLTTYDASPIIDGNASVIGTGSLVFAGNTPTLSITTTAGLIAANVNVNTAAGSNFTLNTNPLTISGVLTLTNGTVTLNTNLTLTNQTFNITSGFDGWAGAATLILNPTVAPMTWNYNIATPSIINLDIRNNVDLAGSVTTLNVTGTLTLTSGVFNYGTKNLQIDAAANLTRELGATDGTGTFNTTAATTGFLILNGANVLNGDNVPALSANHVRFTGNATTFNGAATYGSFTINNTLDINNAAVGTTSVLNGKVTVASNVTVNWTKGKFAAAPNYVTPINLNLTGYTHNDNLDATVWPSGMPALVATLRVLGTLATDQVNLPATGTRTVNSANSLYLTSGILNINGSTLNLASGINVYRTDAGSIIGANLVFPGDNNYNLYYYANGGVIASGIELPAILNNLTIARTVNGPNNATTLGKTVTVNGTLDIKNDVTQLAPFYVQANGTINIVRDASYSLSTVPAVNLASFVIGGVNGQTMTLGGNVQFPNVTVDLQTTVTNPVLNVYGSFTMIAGAANRLSFNNGIINMVDGILYLPRPTGASNSGLGYVVTGTGHVVGNVARTGAANDGQVTDGRFVFPTGTAPDLANGRKAFYRPITITFNGTYPLGSPVTFIVNHKTVSPDGVKGFENGLDGGAGVTIGKYPNFYWGVTASPAGLSQTQMYDVEMQGSNLGYPYDSYTKLRGIRRLGNSLSNPWLLLTTDGDNNSQQIFGTDTTVWVRSTATQGGIVSTESRFTIGIPVIAPGFAVPATSPVAVAPSQEAVAVTLPYTVATNILGGPAPVVTYTLLPAPPAGVGGSIVAPALSQTTVGGQVSGNFTWTPGYQAAGTYTLTITAVDNGGTATAVYNLTITDNNRAPQATNVTPAQPKVGVPVTITFNGTDADGDPITWNRAFVGATPSGAVTPAVGNVVGNQYVITFTPNFADLHQTYTFQATYTDGKIGAPLTLNVPLQQVIMPQNYGDVNRDGNWTSADAIEALRMSVGLTTSYTTPVFTYDQYNYALADVDNIHNVGNVVTYGATSYGISAWDAYLILMKSINPANTFPVGVAKPAPASGELALGKAVAKENGTVAVPLTVQNAKDIYTVTFELSFDTKVAEVVGLTNTPKDWLTAYSVENGVVKVVMAGVNSINASNLGELNLRMKNKEDKVQISGTATINNLESKTLATMTVGQVPAKFALDQNYPNPFNPSTTIKYQIAEPTKVTIAIYSIDGQLVNTLVSDTKDAGYYSVVWNGTNSFGKQVASGMYIYRIDAGNFVSTKKLMLMK